MNRRELVTLAALGAASSAPALGAAPAAAAPAGPVLLTLTGAIARTNRGPLDPALDQLMVKQQVRFERAFAIDAAALARLPAHAIRPTLEYDGRPHRLAGPLLSDVVALAGGLPAGGGRLLLRALDGYAVSVTAAQVREHRFIVATQIDDRPMALGGLGPLWAVHDADRIPALAARPVNERFALCPWGLYHVEVQQG